MLVDPVGEEQAPFRALPQAAVGFRRRVVVVHSDAVDVDILEHVLGIPAEEAKDASRHSAPSRIPVVMRPVVVARVEVHQHVVRQVEHIKVLLEGVVVRERSQPGSYPGHHGVPRRGITIDYGAAVVAEDVPFVLVAAKVLFAIAVVRAFVYVEDAPEEAVEKDRAEPAAGGEGTHGQLQVADKHVADVLAADPLVVAWVGEGQVEVRIEDEIVKAVDRRAGEEVIVQLALAIGAPEGEPVGRLL